MVLRLLNAIVPRVSNADGLPVEAARTATPFGFTERQARFLATVMLHSGVFVGRQYAAFAGITHGQKVHDFIEKLLIRKFVTPIELGSTGRTRIFHVHHKPLYAAIGEPDNRNRRRVTIDRAIERLMILDGVLADRSVTWLGSEREKRRYFKQRLGEDLRDDEYPRLVFGKRPNVTVRYFPDKLPIGYDGDHRRHVFMYLARSPSPMDFRVFILRHLELLNALGLLDHSSLVPAVARRVDGGIQEGRLRAPHEAVDTVANRGADLVPSTAPVPRDWTLRPQIEPACKQLERRFAARASPQSGGTGSRKETVPSSWQHHRWLATPWSVGGRASSAWNCRMPTSISLLLRVRSLAGKAQNRGMKLSG